MADQIPDKNLFMMCQTLNTDALRKLPKGFHVRYCRKNELDIWKAMHFNTPEIAMKYYDFMTDYFNSVYLPKKDLFYQSCLFICNKFDKPVGTCFVWKSYNTIHTLHWFKVLKEYEGIGIGRALLSIVMERLSQDEYPVFLHTQPSSYRAIKLYSDFGFHLLSDPVIGNRKNDLEDCLPILEKFMPESDFKKLRIVRAPKFFLDAVCSTNTSEF
ncbi:GNAT family N-acetyltransferase [Lederbergia citrea]|uniref:GNAT family N-acetyltransferase n=1 Tax=Lederbergia citrea TaxID=2833581 RepID=A0A942UQP1_9BACI|nr:GNAT family N-acetyltransferase [Lederbergia citrea]MBS4203069.1 GNAT family N-acetyltransferase [Lederbergia citrea]MBS4222259.1 GNAT family N-acetyltransferase [Lederbergia citrea]